MALDNGKISLAKPSPPAVPRRNPRNHLGRLLFNEIFPEDFPFQDETMTKKRLQKVMAEVYAQYGQEKTAEIADDLKDLGFYYATISGLSMGMGDFEPIKGMEKVLDEGEDAPPPFPTSTKKASLPMTSATA